MLNFDIYADGGVIGVNPSAEGGTWAYLHLNPEGTEPTLRMSGVCVPELEGMPTISNNYTELYAAVAALEAAPDGWEGRLHTDSHVTRCRLVNVRPGMAGIPDELRDRLFAQRARFKLTPDRVVLLDGHPTRAQLESGVGKRGNPVSRWNVACDEACNRAARDYRASAAAPSPT
jgi:hypothetical protein